MNWNTKKEFDPKATDFGGRDVYVAIEGVIGVGKTSLTRLLRDRWQAQAVFEGFETNPFLTQGFYDDREAHGFNTELFFLLTRFRQQKQVLEQSGPVVGDYIFEKNWIFARMNLKDEDKRIYENVYRAFVPELRRPDLVVLLQADLETLLRRIYFRDREFERSLSPEYLEKLSNEYYRFFSSFVEAPILRIQTSGLDFVNDPNDLDKVCSLIEDRLSGQVQLPLTQSQSEKTEVHV